MKKVFLLSLGIVFGFSAFAQRTVSKNELKEFQVDSKKVAVGNEMVTTASSFAPQSKGSMVTINRWDSMEDGETMWTNYDLQSNGYLSNRMYQLPTGQVAVTATMSHEANQSASDRGTGYNFYDGSEWDEMPDGRVESMKTGWPTIAQWGATGEILISHAPMRCWTREVAGEGEWQYMGEIPTQPEGYPYTDDASWPRVATSGDNHNIIHVIADIQHSVSTNEVYHHQVYLRSEDAQNWTVSYSPLAQDGEEADHYSADDYAITANGHTVAMIYSGSLTSHVVMYKSTNDGATWERTVVWENPYYGCDWETDPCSVYTDTLFGPNNASIVIDNNGIAHVALNVYEYIHSEIGNTYTVFSGRAVDGIYYWNETRPAPIQSSDGNPHHALRLWWPSGDGYVSHSYDTVNFCGWIPFGFDEFSWDNDMFYHEHDYFYAFYGASALPALSCDPDGNLAVAFSTPYTPRTDGSSYFRQVFVNYKSKDEDYWRIEEDNLMDDFMYEYMEGTGVSAVSNTANTGEFWFSFQADENIGFYWGTNAQQASASENTIHAVKVIIDEFVGIEENAAQDVVYNIYPNPATDYICISAEAAAEATVSFVNLAGQTVKVINKSLTIGDNSISINLESGVYFCTVTANGFSKTTKVVVK